MKHSLYQAIVKTKRPSKSFHVQIPWGRDGQPVLRTDDGIDAIRQGKAHWYAVDGSLQVSQVGSVDQAATSLTERDEQVTDVIEID